MFSILSKTKTYHVFYPVKDKNLPCFLSCQRQKLTMFSILSKTKIYHVFYPVKDKNLPLTLFQTTNTRLIQTQRVCRRIFQNFMKMTENSKNGWKTLWEKEKLLVRSNFSFSHSVFKRPVLPTRKNQGLFGKGLKLHIFHCLKNILSLVWSKILHRLVKG